VSPRVQSGLRGRLLDLRPFRDLQGILELYAKVSDNALEFRVSEEQLIALTPLVSHMRVTTSLTARQSSPSGWLSAVFTSRSEPKVSEFA
jgi:hypothetical protein